ncbi:SURF1 family protein [Tibeticola sp.]|uniref:SURF1 family protein n=1 Tax=Tibeticola sp. TaxID=2005368 RepID=UPI0025FB267E|nr:SURF1 family protein [Tibeticola sp.]
MSQTQLGWRFWIITAAALIGIATTAALGFWQLSRAAQREALEARRVAAEALAELDASALTTPGTLDRRVVVRGRWIASHTVYLDNRQMDGRAGFEVLTPLRLEGSNQVILVQRGWVPRNFENRAALPQVATPEGVVEVRGRISPSPPKLYEIGGAGSGAIRQNLDIPSFRLETGLPLLDVSIQQTGNDESGLLRHWAMPASGADRNYGYAFQWFGLSTLIFLLYFWFQIVRRFFLPRRAA